MKKCKALKVYVVVYFLYYILSSFHVFERFKIKHAGLQYRRMLYGSYSWSNILSYLRYFLYVPAFILVIIMLIQLLRGIMIKKIIFNLFIIINLIMLGAHLIRYRLSMSSFIIYLIFLLSILPLFIYVYKVNG